MDLARSFWNRIDELRGNVTLKDLSLLAGLNYDTLRNKRSGRTPALLNLEDSYKIAKSLNTSIEYLLTGKNFSISIEAQYVESHPEMKTLVRYCMNDTRLISALQLIIEQAKKEESAKKQA